jgi:hypothetical protein
MLLQNRCLARCADHLVVRVVEDLLLRAVAGERLRDGQYVSLHTTVTATIYAARYCLRHPAEI